MATVYGSYISSAFRSRADISTSQTNEQVTISVTGYCQMADYYHDSGENFFRKIVIGSDTPNKYVTASTAYFSGGGTYGVGSSSRTYNRTHSAQSIEVGVAIHNDGEYTGWSTDDSYARTTVTVPAKPSYAVSFNANGGSGAPSGQTKWYGETLTLSSTKPTRTGYTFKNWNTKADGSGTSYAAGASYTANAVLALYAQWAINTWTVSYNANGGSSTPASQTKTYNVALTLRGAISRSNASATGYKVTYDANGGSCSTSSATAARTTKYTFNKWNTKSDGSGTAYNAGASYTGNAALSLYATWTSSTTTSAVTLPTPSRTGYAFDGWYTAASGGTRVGGAGGSYTPTGAVTLHAHWTQNTWTVSYAANGGSSTPASQTKLYGQALTLRPAISRSNATATYTVSYSANYSGGTNPSSATATKTTKYAFSGWKATNGTTYAASGSYTTNAATTMTAQWTSSASTTSVTLPTPTRTGYTFGGWYKESACTNKVGNGGASYTPTASIQLFAKWTVNTWTVAYSANGGTGAPASQTKTYGQTLTLSSTRPARSGYTFLGWATKSDGTGTAYAPGGSYTANAAATLYAVWVAVQVASLSAYRSNSAGTRSDSGTYGHLSAGWKAMGTIAGTVAVTATANDADVTSSLSNRSGSKTATDDLSNTSVGTFGGSYAQDAAVRVSVTATLTVSYGGSSRSVSATRVATIPKVFRLLDALHGGTGLAIGAIATLANTFEVALQTVFQNIVEVVQSNITRDGTYTEPANGDHQIRFVDSSRRILSYLSAHKTANSPNNYLRLTACGPSGSKNANVYLSASDTDGYISTDCLINSNLMMSTVNKGYYLKGRDGASYPGIYNNGSNLWIGSTATASTHHVGETYISAGYDATNSKGHPTIYVSVPNATNDNGTNYGVYHTGYKPSASDVGALPIGGGTLTGSLKLSSGGITTTTGAHTIKDMRFDRDGDNPSENVWSAVFGFQDKNGENLGYLQAYQLTNGTTGLSLQAYADGTDGTQHGNLFRVSVNKNGTQAYTLGNATAFLSALGVTSGNSTTSTGVWHWVKLPGNIAIAHYDDSSARSIACTSASGNIYYGSVSNIAFPFSFSHQPTVSVSLSGTGNAWTQASLATTSGTGTMFFGRGTSSTLSNRLHITVIGIYS